MIALATVTRRACTLTLAALSSITLAISAQDKPADKPTEKPSQPSHRVNCLANSDCVVKTFYLSNSIQGSETNEILVALRNILDPSVKIYLVASQNAIVVDAPSDQMTIVEKLLHDLDRPKKTYRLTYTLTDVDGGKPVGTEHFSMIVVGGQHTTLKQGSKIPVATGSYSTDHNASQTQFTYLDVGMNFDASLDELANGVRLQTKVEESSAETTNTIAGVTEPVIRQAVLQGTAFLTPGKPVSLGSVDISGTTRRLDIVVIMDVLP
jgi:type II secretory pathway component GspD/PulD (secretin)